MPMAHALALCPTAIIVSARHHRYHEYSQQVMAVLHQASPLMEQMSIDEAYLDLTGQVEAWEEGVEIARQLQRQIKDGIGLSASLGVAANKLVAKVASDRNKPGGLTVVRLGEEASFLAPLPARVLWGIGPVTEKKLAELGVTTVAGLAQLPEEDLRARFGRQGVELARMARGIDERPLVAEHEVKSISQETTFNRDVADPAFLRRQAWQLSQGVSRHLKRRGMAAGTVAVKLRYHDFATLTRQMRLSAPTDDEREIYRAALVLLRRAWQRGRPVRLLGVAARELSPPTGQLALWKESQS